MTFMLCRKLIQSHHTKIKKWYQGQILHKVNIRKRKINSRIILNLLFQDIKKIIHKLEEQKSELEKFQKYSEFRIELEINIYIYIYIFFF